MGRIHIDLFTTLDGVAQAPGGPEEDSDGGFRFGGWQAPLIDEVSGQQIRENLADLDALLLGRRTYEIFAAYWPHQRGEIADPFNRVPKYVASRSTPELGWAGSTLLGPDLAGAVREIRDRHEHVHVIGSIDFVQTLLAEQLFDRLTLWVHPVVLGHGKRVFPEGATPANVRLTDPPVASPNGIVRLRYAPAGGPPETGDMAQ
jgi:dihydrofolate reductase